MTDNLQTSTLCTYLDACNKNFHGFKDLFPQTYLAAEELNDLFDQLFTQKVSPHTAQLWETEAQRMLFGAYSSWVQAFVMTASGLGELGLAALRRSIDFTCYAAKIKGSDERANLWLSRNEDTKSKKSFNGQFGIPRSFFGAEYAHLKILLVWHDHASDFGAHGNFAALATKSRDDQSTQELVMSFQDDPKHVPISVGTTLLIGSYILDSFILDLKDIITEPDSLHKRVSVFKNMLTQSRIEVAKYEGRGTISAEILRSITSGDQSGMLEYFEQLKKEYTS